MGHYLPSTEKQRGEMLEAIGLASMEQLYDGVPRGLRLSGELKLPGGKSELEVLRGISDIATKNKVYSSIFRGAGAYNHYIPAAVSSVTSKETFLTSYTPYQAELSQGILQSIFEYQTMICELTGMDVSNASVYDGAAAAAEAAMLFRERGRGKVFISSAAHPEVIETVRTYCWAANAELELIPQRGGVTDTAELEKMLDGRTACVYIQQPNYYGLIEPAEEISALTHAKAAKLIMGINPIAAAIIKTPGECGADAAVGEGQPLGMPLAFGGPYLGFMAVKSNYARKLPGRIVGETADGEGRRAYVLTLQAREQHIRREKASSNICSNQALCAMTAAVYMACMGPQGMREAAEQCLSKAHYLQAELGRIKGFEPKYSGEFFHEFVTNCPVDPETLIKKLDGHGILGGLPVDGGILWCATEMNTKSDMDRLVSLLKEVTDNEAAV